MICHVVVIQWVGEIERYTAKESVWFILSCGLIFKSGSLSIIHSLFYLARSLYLLSRSPPRTLSSESSLTRSVPLDRSKLGFRRCSVRKAVIFGEES